MNKTTKQSSKIVRIKILNKQKYTGRSHLDYTQTKSHSKRPVTHSQLKSSIYNDNTNDNLRTDISLPQINDNKKDSENESVESSN